uniref:40S ribosomal protein S8 n=1 Tax=Hirondellea gigas TaxID=1518452 RepID=A0A2P2I550_9CRUS
MGISRDSRHKRRHTGGRRKIHQKKRKYELGRPQSNTKIGKRTVRLVRTRGGNHKYRALRLETGNFSWGSENCTRKTRILDVVFNASDNELLRTKTLVKNAIVLVDAGAFKQWYEKHYDMKIGKKDNKKDPSAAQAEETEEVEEPVKRSKRLQKRIEARKKNQELDKQLDEQFASGRLWACISSRPGQVGRCDGYILEGKELEFYHRKIGQKRKH